MAQSGREVYGSFTRKLASIFDQYSDGEILHLSKMQAAFYKLNLYPSTFQVFLGGSCNPTTWRQDVAIPFLEKRGITFYNPQVDDWIPELVSNEDEAKQASEVLLFVIDDQARSISSMIEVAYLIGCQRKIVVILKDFQNNHSTLAGERLSESELSDITRSHAILKNIIELNNYPTFNKLETALCFVADMIKQRVTAQQLVGLDCDHPVSSDHVCTGDLLQQLWKVFQFHKNETSENLSFEQACQAFHHLMGQSLDLRNLCLETDLHWISFEEFCCLSMEARKQLLFPEESENCLLKTNLNANCITQPVCPLRNLTDSFQNQLLEKCEDDIGSPTLIWLGGSCGETDWREQIAIPILKKQSLTFINPSKHCTDHLVATDYIHREKCLLLYVITGETWSCEAMMEASYYIGQKYRIVLCLQKILQSALAQEQMSPNAIRDYNRGRTYLRDIAEREKVAIFASVDAAVNCAVKWIKPPFGAVI